MKNIFKPQIMDNEDIIECKNIKNKLSSGVPCNDNSNIKIIKVNNKFINLDIIKKQKQDYKNLVSAGFEHSVCIWEYLGLTKEEYKAIRRYRV